MGIKDKELVQLMKNILIKIWSISDNMIHSKLKRKRIKVHVIEVKIFINVSFSLVKMI